MMKKTKTISFINNLIDFWEEDTRFRSGWDNKHPVIKILKKMEKDIVVRTIIKRIQKDRTLFM